MQSRGVVVVIGRLPDPETIDIARSRRIAASIMNGTGSHSAPTSRRSSVVTPSPTIAAFQISASPLHNSAIQTMPTAFVESQQNQLFYQNLLPQPQHQAEQSQKL